MYRAGEKNFRKKKNKKVATRSAEEMEGGYEVREANVVTLCSKGEIPYCVSRKPSLDGVCLGRLVGSRNQQIRSQKTPRIASEARRRILCRKERRERKVFKTSRTSSAPPRLRVRFARAASHPGSPMSISSSRLESSRFRNPAGTAFPDPAGLSSRSCDKAREGSAFRSAA